MGCSSCGTMSPKFCNNCCSVFPGLDIGILGASCACGGRIREYMIVNFQTENKNNDANKVICLECKREAVGSSFIGAYKKFFEDIKKEKHV